MTHLNIEPVFNLSEANVRLINHHNLRPIEEYITQYKNVEVDENGHLCIKYVSKYQYENNLTNEF